MAGVVSTALIGRSKKEAQEKNGLLKLFPPVVREVHADPGKEPTSQEFLLDQHARRGTGQAGPFTLSPHYACEPTSPEWYHRASRTSALLHMDLVKKNTMKL